MVNTIIQKIKKSIYPFLFKERVVYMSKDQSLKDKVIFITGASRGLGRTLATVMLDKGASVVLFVRDPEGTEKKFKSFVKNKVLIVKGDVTSEATVKNGMAKAIKEFGRIDVLINNAGLFSSGKLEGITETQWDKIMAVNVKGVFLTTKAVIPYMLERKSGLVINIGSKISHNPNIDEKNILYATSKHAVEGFSYVLSRNLKKYGIRVSCLMPGTINTFLNLRPDLYLSPYQVGKIACLMIEMEDVDFESIIFKSLNQDI